MERVSAGLRSLGSKSSNYTRHDSQMRQFYEDLDTLESGLAEVAGMQTKTVCTKHFPRGAVHVLNALACRSAKPSQMNILYMMV